MPTQRYNDELMGLALSQLQGRAEPQFAWQKILSMYMLLPGLRGFWPMSTFDGTARAMDHGGSGLHLTYNGDPVYRVDGLAPYIDLDGTGDYLNRGTEAAFEIRGAVGSEPYVGAPGLTLGCWFYPEDDASNDYLMSKQGAAAQRAYLISATGNVANDPFRITISDDGTAQNSASNTNITYNAWNFGVGRFNAADAGAELAAFVNGTVVTAATAMNSIHNSNADFLIGGRALGPANLFTGKIALAFLCVSAVPNNILNALFAHARTAFAI